jgi:hypothetical protein
VYQEILASHLGVDPREVLSESFEQLAFVRQPVEARTSAGFAAPRVALAR